MTPLSLALYQLATQGLSPLAPALLRQRAAAGKEDLARLNERLGKPARARPAGQLVWLHGASVGESLSLLPLAKSLRATRPDLGLLFTSGTVASAELMRRRAPDDAIHQFAPLDTPSAVAGFLSHWRPTVGVLAESDIWPNLVLEAHAQGVKLALVSARLSEASLAGWARFPSAARRLFGAFDLVLAQDANSGVRLAQLGARRDGELNLKLAGDALPVDGVSLRDAREALGQRPLLLAASTHPGEDEGVLQAFETVMAHPSSPLLVIAPRHPTRGGDIVALARTRGLEVARRSLDEGVTPLTQVLVADTLGELGLWFRLARLALIGGSILPGIGGHNPLEAARLSCPFVSGPHVENWRPVFAALEQAQAVLYVSGATDLGDAFRTALNHPEADRARAERAFRLASTEDGALQAAASQILTLVGTAS